MATAEPTADDSLKAKELQISEALSDVESLKSTNRELLTVANVYTDATDMLIPAPSAIYLGAKLILLSNKCDFTIQLRPGSCIPHPSFRSSLTHVVHQLQRSFLMADDTMSTIQLRTTEMPRQFKDLMKWISSEASIAEKEVGIQMQLKKLSNSASVCEKVAKDVVDQFDKVSQLTEELIEATVQQQNLTEDEIKQLEKKKIAKMAIDDEAKLRQAEYDRQLRQLQAEVSASEEKLKSSVAVSDKMVNRAMVTTMFGQIFTSVMSVVETAITIPFGITSRMSLGFKRGESREEPFEVVSEQELAIAERKAAGTTALTKAPMLADMAFGLLEFITENGTISDHLLNEVRSDIGYMETFQEIKRQLGQLRIESPRVRRAIGIANQGWTVCGLLGKYRSTPDNANVPQIVDRIKQLSAECQSFSDLAKEKGITKNHIATEPISYPKRTASRRTCSKGSTVQSVVDYAHNRTNNHLRYLQLQLSRLEKVSAQKDLLAQEFLQRTLELQQIDISTVDYKRIRQCLSEGLKVLSELRDHWLQLVSFAHLMSTLITQSLNVNITSIDQTASKLVDLSLRKEMTDAGRTLMVDTIHTETLAALQMSLITKHLAGGYVAISKEFLMPSVRQLDSLLVSDDPILADVQCASQVKLANQGIRLEMANSKRRCATEIAERINELTAARGKLPPVGNNRLSIDNVTEVDSDESDDDFNFKR